MKMKMYEIRAFENFYKKIKEKKMPLRVAYKLNKLFQETQKSTVFYDENLNKIIEKFGERDEDGNFVPTKDGTGIKIQENKINECSVELEELSNLIIDLPETKFTLDELEDLDLTIDQIGLLMPFIEE